MNEIPLIDELEKLHIHLKDNPRTILSSAFGNGKTTLLRQYMEKYESEGEYIILHPVNYSCGTNEDVFEYIKRDILVQLGKKELLSDIDWDAIDSTLFSWDNFKDLIGFLISLAPGGSHLANFWDKVQPWIDKAIEKNKEYDEIKHTFDKYECFFVNQKGGIYEHDAYTTLIEEAIKTIQKRKPVAGRDIAKNRTTLIVEDMDRIDPAHLFRILNVLGAHLDLDAAGNKFGFNNIILVMDYYTTEHIFHHFYGKEANYQGYINKFISHTVYHFDIAEAARNELKNLLVRSCPVDKNFLMQIPVYGVGQNTVNLESMINDLCVRDIANIIDNLENQIIKGVFYENGHKIESVAPITYLFAVLVRTNRRISYNMIFEHLSSSHFCINLLQQYLLHESTFNCGVPFRIGGERFAIADKENPDGTSTINVQIYNGMYQEAKDESTAIRRCFNLAMSKVKGCKY